MEGNSVSYVLLHASPVLLVVWPALILAGMAFVVCLAERVPAYLQVRHTFLYLPLLAGACIASVAAWQYAARALSLWTLILGATPVEAFFGWVYYQVARRDAERKEGQWVVFLHRLTYGAFMLGLTLIGAFVWGRGMRLVSGSVPIMGFVAAWMFLFIPALLVGTVAWHYVNDGCKPISCLFRKPGNLWQTRAAVRLAVSVKAADPRLPQSISEGYLRSRFGHLAELLRAEDQPVTKETLLRLYGRHYEETDQLRIQRECAERNSAQDRERAVEESKLTQARRKEATKRAIAIASKVLDERLLVPSRDAHDLYRQRLMDLADELERQGEELTSNRLVERYDQCWGQGGLVEFIRAKQKQEVKGDDSRQNRMATNG